jgi:uncharacterized protein YggU (UPF0235/DUF167 family)
MARITARVHPRASRNQVQLEPDGVLSIWITAPPIENRANDAVRQLLARRLRIRSSQILIAVGAHGRTKLLDVDDLTEEDVRQRLGEPTETESRRSGRVTPERRC